MRWLPKAVPVLIAVIAFDLALVFGFEAYRVLTSPVYGLEQIPFARLVHGIGSLFGLHGVAMFKVAAFLGAIYLTIAGVFALHLVSRVGAWRGMRVSHDLLDAGLILVVMVTMVVAMPAIMQGASEVLVQGRLPLWLVGLAATLSMIERFPETEDRAPGRVERLFSWYARRVRKGRPVTITPAVRGGTSPERWTQLRDTAGLSVAPSPLAKAEGPWFTLNLR